MARNETVVAAGISLLWKPLQPSSTKYLFDFDLRLFPQHRYTYCYNIQKTINKTFIQKFGLMFSSEVSINDFRHLIDWFQFISLIKLNVFSLFNSINGMKPNQSKLRGNQLILLNQQLLESFNLAATNRSNFITFKFALSFLANRAGLNSDFTIHSVLIRPVRN